MNQLNINLEPGPKSDIIPNISSSYKKLSRIILTLLTIIIQNIALSAQEPKIFEYIIKRDFESLKNYLDTTQTSINKVNSRGYSPLHVLIENYVDYDVSLCIDINKYQENVEINDFYSKTLRLLLDKGASVYQKTPEGWYPIQYAAIKGKWQPIDEIVSRFGMHDVRDDEGNTLLHLSLLTDPQKTIPKFWNYLENRVSKDGISINSPNKKGQTPVCFYLSVPRCSTNNECLSSNALEMIKEYFSIEALMTPDFSGKNAVDYAKQYNTWADFSISFYLNLANESEARYNEWKRKFDEQVEENMRKIKEYEAQKAREESENKKYRRGCNETCYKCFGFGTGDYIPVEVECPVCNGRGDFGWSTSVVPGFTHDIVSRFRKTCWKCDGRGTVIVYEQEYCRVCKGTGCLD